MDLKNRCGVGRLSTGPSDPFHEECVLHDIGYLEGGDVDQMWQVDKDFFKGIWKKALKKPVLVPRALFYTVAVSICGRWVWRN